jgi:hypothetical protein
MVKITPVMKIISRAFIQEPETYVVLSRKTKCEQIGGNKYKKFRPYILR